MSDSEQVKYELCDNNTSDLTRCAGCEHKICYDCSRLCDICASYICELCDREHLEELICEKCATEQCIHGYLVGYNYQCEQRKCNGKMIDKRKYEKKILKSQKVAINDE